MTFRGKPTWPPAPIFSELTPEGQRMFAEQWTKDRRASECGHEQCRDDDQVYGPCVVREED